MVDLSNKVSQFAGAAALFQKKDSDLKMKEDEEDEEAKKRQQEAANKAEKRKQSQFSGAGSTFQQRAGASAGNLNVTMSPPGTSKRSSLKLPSFVSPGPGAAKSEAEKGWKSQSSEPSPLPFGSSSGTSRNYPTSTSSYLKNPSGTPAPPQKDKRPTFSTSYLNKGAGVTPTSTRTKLSFAAGFNGLPFTPSPSSDKPKLQLQLPKATSQSWKDKGTGISFQATGTSPQTPTQTKKPSISAGSNGRPFTPSPSSDKPKLPKVTGQSWKHKGISFQATSPQAVKKPSAAPTYYGGSYIQKSSDTKTTKSKFSSSGLQEFADTKIEVKIPGIDEKIRARLAAAQIPPPKSDDEKVPEHLKKFREREERRLAALDEKQRKAEEKQRKAEETIQAMFLGWWARAQLPKIRAEKEERLRKLAEEEAERLRKLAEERAHKKLRIESSTKIQALYRGLSPRTEFLRLITVKRRRDANENRIKEIDNEIKKMPKSIKADIKAMKEEYKVRKKEMKKKVKEEVRAEEQKMEEFKKQGSNMIQYMQDENRKRREQKAVTKRDIKTLGKQAGVLTEKQDEIEARFNSLILWSNKKNAEVQKREINSQKCRNRYLPKYRAEMADRNKHCIQEYRVKMLYKARLYRIVEELQAKSKDPELVEDTVEALEELEEELGEFPKIPVPEGLANWLN